MTIFTVGYDSVDSLPEAVSTEKEVVAYDFTCRYMIEFETYLDSIHVFNLDKWFTEFQSGRGQEQIPFLAENVLRLHGVDYRHLEAVYVNNEVLFEAHDVFASVISLYAERKGLTRCDMSRQQAS